MNRLGISAYNRQREFVSGRNSKGTTPGIQLDARRIGVIVAYGTAEPEYVELGEDLTADGIELALQALRIVPERLAFCRARGVTPITTAALGKKHGAKRKPRKPMPRRHVMPRVVAA